MVLKAPLNSNQPTVKKIIYLVIQNCYFCCFFNLENIAISLWILKKFTALFLLLVTWWNRSKNNWTVFVQSDYSTLCLYMCFTFKQIQT